MVSLSPRSCNPNAKRKRKRNYKSCDIRENYPVTHTFRKPSDREKVRGWVSEFLGTEISKVVTELAFPRDSIYVVYGETEYVLDLANGPWEAKWHKLAWPPGVRTARVARWEGACLFFVELVDDFVVLGSQAGLDLLSLVTGSVETLPWIDRRPDFVEVSFYETNSNWLCLGASLKQRQFSFFVAPNLFPCSDLTVKSTKFYFSQDKTQYLEVLVPEMPLHDSAETVFAYGCTVDIPRRRIFVLGGAASTQCWYLEPEARNDENSLGLGLDLGLDLEQKQNPESSWIWRVRFIPRMRRALDFPLCAFAGQSLLLLSSGDDSAYFSDVLEPTSSSSEIQRGQGNRSDYDNSNWKVLKQNIWESVERPLEFQVPEFYTKDGTMKEGLVESEIPTPCSPNSCWDEFLGYSEQAEFGEAAVFGESQAQRESSFERHIDTVSHVRRVGVDAVWVAFGHHRSGILYLPTTPKAQRRWVELPPFPGRFLLTRWARSSYQ